MNARATWPLIHRRSLLLWRFWTTDMILIYRTFRIQHSRTFITWTYAIITLQQMTDPFNLFWFTWVWQSSYSRQLNFDTPLTQRLWGIRQVNSTRNQPFFHYVYLIMAETCSTFDPLLLLIHFWHVKSFFYTLWWIKSYPCHMTHNRWVIQKYDLLRIYGIGNGSYGS